MQKSIAASRNELDRLHTEWERCLREEAAIIKEKPPAENLDARQTLDKLVMQAEGIVADKADKLDEMDQVRCFGTKFNYHILTRQRNTETCSGPNQIS